MPHSFGLVLHRSKELRKLLLWVVGEGATPFSGLLHLLLIRTLQCWVLSKEVSSTKFQVFGISQPGIEPRSPGALVNTLTIIPVCVCVCVCVCSLIPNSFLWRLCFISPKGSVSSYRLTFFLVIIFSRMSFGSLSTEAWQKLNHFSLDVTLVLEFVMSFSRNEKNVTKEKMTLSVETDDKTTNINSSHRLVSFFFSV